MPLPHSFSLFKDLEISDFKIPNEIFKYLSIAMPRELFLLQLNIFRDHSELPSLKILNFGPK